MGRTKTKKLMGLLAKTKSGLDELRALVEEASFHIVKGNHMKAWFILDQARNYEAVRKRTSIRGFFQRIKDALPVKLVAGDPCPECGRTLTQSGSYITCRTAIGDEGHVFHAIVRCAKDGCKRRSKHFVNGTGYCKEHGEAAWLRIGQ